MHRLLVIGAVAVAALVSSGVAAAWTWPADGQVLRPFALGNDAYAAGQHRGIDIAGAEGSPVRAPAAGTVTFAGSVPTHGRGVTIVTADGYSVTAFHLGAIGVAKGDVVEEGSTIGTMGWSGDAEHAVPSVHLGIRVAAQAEGYVDPLGLLPPRAASPARGSPPAPSPAPAATPAPTPAQTRAPPSAPVPPPPSAANGHAAPAPTPAAPAPATTPAAPAPAPSPVSSAGAPAPSAIPAPTVGDAVGATSDPPLSQADEGTPGIAVRGERSAMAASGGIGVATATAIARPRVGPAAQLAARRAAPVPEQVERQVTVVRARLETARPAIGDRGASHAGDRRGDTRVGRTDRTPATTSAAGVPRQDGSDLVVAVTPLESAGTRARVRSADVVPASRRPIPGASVEPFDLRFGVLLASLLAAWAALGGLRRARRIGRDGAVLPDDADLLRELDAAHRSCVHDRRGGRVRPAPAAARP